MSETNSQRAPQGPIKGDGSYDKKDCSRGKCVNSSHNYDKDCDQCRIYIPVFGTQGPQGPQGQPGAPGPGTIIPYGSGQRFAFPGFGDSRIISTIGFGDHHEFFSVQNALDESQDIFIVPRNGKIKSLFFSAFVDQNFITSFDSPIAELWRSTDGGNTYNQFANPVVAVASDLTNLPYATGNIKLNPGEDVTEGDHLILVILFNFNVSGVEVPQLVPMAFRAGLLIE